LVGANRDFILNRIPHISKLMVADIDAVLEHAQTVVIGTKDPEFETVAEGLRDDQILVDLSGVITKKGDGKKYDGICL
jgi:GDP-mannose 6-dehydrogenase